jgi:recombination protein RecA
MDGPHTAPTPDERIAAVLGRLHQEVPEARAQRLDSPPERVRAIPTGSLGLDRALGTGGYPQGRIVEVYGAEASGKTTLLLHAIASAQARGGIAAFIDAEHALDLAYTRALGVQIPRLIFSQPDHGEQALGVVEALLRSNFGPGDIVVVDSVAALTPRAEIEGRLGDDHRGAQAQLLSQALRRLVGLAAQTGATILLSNQTRPVYGTPLGAKTTTVGGTALRFFASVRLEVRRLGSIVGGGDSDRHRVADRLEVVVVKNKLAPPFRSAEVVLRYGQGISRADELLDLGVQCGVVQAEPGTQTYTFAGVVLGATRSAALARLRAAPEPANQIEHALRQRFGDDRG